MRDGRKVSVWEARETLIGGVGDGSQRGAAAVILRVGKRGRVSCMRESAVCGVRVMRAWAANGARPCASADVMGLVVGAELKDRRSAGAPTPQARGAGAMLLLKWSHVIRSQQ